jgi:hypothetical protein
LPKKLNRFQAHAQESIPIWGIHNAEVKKAKKRDGRAAAMSLFYWEYGCREALLMALR